MPRTHLPLSVRLGGIRSLLSFCAIMTAGLTAVLSPMAVVAWEPALAAVTLLPALLGAGGITYYLWRGFTARRRAREALRHYSRVTHDYEATELQARLIPEGETHGARVMAHYLWFRDEYESLTRSWQDLGSPRGAQWFDPGTLRRVTELEQRSAVLDSIDGVIAGNAAFLSLSPSWERIWYAEQRPVLGTLDLLLELCQQIDSHAFTPGGTVEAREQVRAHHQRLTEMTVQLSAGRLRPSAALDELAWIAADVRRSVRTLSFRTAGASPSRGLPGTETHRRRSADEWPNVVGTVVGPGEGMGNRQRADGYTTTCAGPPLAPARAGLLGDGAFPGS